MILFVLLMAAQAAHALDSVPKAEYRQRRVKLAAELHGGSAVILAAHEPPMEYQDYRQDEDFFYLTGSNEPGGALLSSVRARHNHSPWSHSGARLPGDLVPSHAQSIREKYTGKKTDAATPGAREVLGRG